MSSLRRARMEEICVLVTDGTHDSPKLQKEGVPFIKGKNISGGTVDFTACDYITAEDHAEACRRVKPQRGDVLFSNIGSVGDTAVVRDDREFSIKNVALFRSDRSKVDPSYFYYLVLSPEFRTNVMNVRSGSAQPFITLGNLRSFEVGYVEEIGVQQRIASILSAYDELIENSQGRIKILEAMARGLYREWFVHFRFPGHENHPRVASSLGEIPQGWEVKTFGELYNTGSGGTPSRARPEYFMDGTIDWVKSQELLDGFVLSTEERITERAILESSAKLFPANSVLVALYGATIGKLAILSRDAATNQACCAVLPKLKSFGREFAYLTLFVNREKIISMRLGAAQQNISQVLLKGLECLKPKDEIVSHFSKVTSPFFDEILVLQRQIQNLRRTRDLLLPRLLSGQIDVTKLDGHEETLS